ncbi:phosphoribosylglycinamide formyltransferase [Rathayibacter rathayi]|uniref:Phosphoribosylglycinamide formyltransferase n=1 Tax=Rathayibacter rathayi TaxID=33887 RepID=A0ABD6W7K8_RATRA|nr:phosphoribosylglycinamide formyltransferase [Rathayibacter rathayi]PPF13699.1 phosphoribosylglycinamide formyltransferase [Rathayibacter rathayi]PPG69438.1 phosphoribosylglycinamide formyltransferase [Rathayibacter rathayi]PPG77199.1 phosphoribosylglycinamide formyltransferase [Rathayibacter rathayi]PPG88540.1 phosphoribosylglycinamide formyltransferase [Rathayibacter rathayi]PPG98861.1 phosphoribosylglycinamide formyltransferase [Rathayibacter rathayi]
MLKLVVLVSGGGSNLRALLNATCAEGFPARIVAVGSDTDAAGLRYADERGTPSFTVAPRDFASRDEWGTALLARIQEWQPDLVVCAGFMRILPPVVVDALSPRMINTHPALLPLFPGAHAVRDALAAGATETGVTVHLIDTGVDTGPIIAQESLAVLPGESEAALHERIKTIERRLLVQTVLDIAHGTVDLEELARA